MADIKWIKITTDMFDNRKIKHLRKLPEGNNIVLIWVMLLTMAGRCNSGGLIFLTENIPYTPKMLADELNFEENTVQLALKALEQFNMIVTDQGFFSIAGWEEYQNAEGLDKIREQTRKRVARHRESQKQMLLDMPGAKESCVYCGKPADTIDHIVPRSKGGPDELWNIVPCCKSCNSSKKDKDLVDFLNDSFALTYQGIDHKLVQRNQKLMSRVYFDTEHERYCNVTVTQCNATDIDKEKDTDIEGDIDKEKEKDIKKTSASASVKPVRHKYGQYQNVLLSDTDMEKLKLEFPEDWEQRIERLSEYIASKGAKYKNHLATIRAWARKEQPAKKKLKYENAGTFV